MINIHIYPSPLTNESRMMRAAGSISALQHFDSVELVGTAALGLRTEEEIVTGLLVRRLGVVSGHSGTVQNAMRIIHWMACVLWYYRNKPVACINCHSLTALPLCVLLKKICNSKLIYDTHELETEKNGLKGLRKLVAKFIEKALISCADCVIVVGDAIGDWYEKCYGLGNVEVIYNCPAFQSANYSNYLRSYFSIPASTPIFLYQGIFASGRGIIPLIEAFGASGEKLGALVLMGYGPLESLVKISASQLKNIYFHPAVPPEQLHNCTVSADYGVSVIESSSLSYEYCLPNKLFEYIMAEKPILCSPTIEQRKIVEKYKIGVVAKSTEVTHIIEAAMILRAASYKKMKEASRTAKNTFNWQNQEYRLFRVYEDLGFLARKSPSLQAEEASVM